MSLDKSEPSQQELTHVVLLGGPGDVAFRLRVAQSHLRHDLKPSHWSHAVLIDTVHPEMDTTPIFEISLEPTRGFQVPTPNNGLQTNEFGAYDDPARFPNIALLRLPVPAADWRDPTTTDEQSSSSTSGNALCSTLPI